MSMTDASILVGAAPVSDDLAGIAAAVAPSIMLMTKTPQRTRIVLADGTTVEGAFFLSRNERLQDLLNGPRLFLPFETDDGTTLLVNKTSIVVCQPLR